MVTKRVALLIFMMFLTSNGGISQTSAPGLAFAQPPDDKDDPGYTTYKAGYNLILDEAWKDARKKFADVISKYPKSEYIDDAQYWSAYALMHLDTKKAIEAYNKFIKDYPGSSYCDDAIADLGQLKAPFVIATASGPEGTRVHVAPIGTITVGKTPKHSYSYGLSSGMRRMSRTLRRELRWLGNGTPRPPQASGKLDPETQLKMEALYAIGNTREDEKSFQTLRDVAIDLKQPSPLREAAIDALSDFKKFDILPVYIEIARKDTGAEMQTFAIEYIAEYGKDKNKTVDVLVDLFNSLPKRRSEQSEMIFYAIAEVGNDKAVDFLTRVALTHDDYTLRTNAVYYLGSIGGDKARGALYEILKGK